MDRAHVAADGSTNSTACHEGRRVQDLGTAEG